MYPLSRVSSVPTTRDASSNAALIRGARTPFGVRRRYGLRETLIQFHMLLLLECVWGLFPYP